MGASSPTIDVVSLRKALGGFLTGVTVVTTIDPQGLPRGMTANSFTSVSLDPPLVLICIGRTAASYDAFRQAKTFAISILGEDQRDVSGLFASKTADKFERSSWRREATGAPVINDALGWLDCSVHDQVAAGDHLILVGKVEGFGANEGAPLGFHGGRYVTFGVDTDTRDRSGGRSVFGALIERDGQILLFRDDAASEWRIPCGLHGADNRHGLAALRDQCRHFGIDVRLNFVYSVFTLDSGEVHIVYRGSPTDAPVTDGGAKVGARWFAMDDIPWDDISDRPVRSMLQRYISERSDDRFGIYAESGDGGAVAMLHGHPAPFGPEHVGRRS